MDFDKYSMYAKTSSYDNGEREVAKALTKLEELYKYKYEKDARRFLSDNWQIKDDIWNYTLANNLIMHVYTGKEFFNITYENLDENNRFIKSFNYIKSK